MKYYTPRLSQVFPYRMPHRFSSVSSFPAPIHAEYVCHMATNPRTKCVGIQCSSTGMHISESPSVCPPPISPAPNDSTRSAKVQCRNRLHRGGKHLSIVPSRVDPTSDLIIPCDHFGETEALPRLKSPDNLEQCDLRGWGVSRGMSRGVSSGGFARRQEEREIGGTRAFDSLLSWRTFFSNIARNSWSAASPSLEPF